MCWACGASGVRPWACTSMCWMRWLRTVAVAVPEAPELFSSFRCALSVTVLAAPLPAGVGCAEAGPAPRDAAATIARTELPKTAVVVRFMLSSSRSVAEETVSTVCLTFGAARANGLEGRLSGSWSGVELHSREGTPDTALSEWLSKAAGGEPMARPGETAGLNPGR